MTATDSKAMTLQDLESATHQLERSDKGRRAGLALAHALDNLYSLDSTNQRAVMTLLAGFFGSYPGTVPELLERFLPMPAENH